MTLPNSTTQDAATYKANIDATAADHDTRIGTGETHAARTDNPHSVTAAQAGAVPAAGGTMTGALTLPEGTAPAPAVGVGSTDKGLYHAGADQLGLAVGGAAHSLFDVNAGYSRQIIQNAGTGALLECVGTATLQIMSDTQGTIWTTGAHALRLGTNSATWVTIGSAGAITIHGSATSYNSYFNLGANQDTYIRGGIAAGKVIIGDQNTGDVELGGGGHVRLLGATVWVGSVASNVAGYTSAGDIALPPDRAVRAKNTAKVWANFDGTGTVAVRRHFNVGSLSDLGTGYYRINHSTPIGDNGAAVPGAGHSGARLRADLVSSSAVVTNSTDVAVSDPAGTLTDSTVVTLIIMADNT